MLLPTIRQLQYLKLLAEHGSFSRAAEAAHVTQPTLSAGVQELEKALGGPVVERARAGVILTAMGREAVRRAEDVLTRVEDLVQAAKAAGRPLSGRFRLGVIPTIAPFLLPRTLPLIRDRFPALRLYLREDLTGRLIAALKSGVLDAALIALPYDTQGLETATVGEDALLALIPEGHRLTSQTRVSPDDFEGEDLILLEDGHCLREHALAACSLEPPRNGPEGESPFAATSLHTVVQMVASGLGVSLLPAMAVDAGLAEGAPIVVRPLDADAPKREIVVAWRAGSSRDAEARLLAEALRAVQTPSKGGHPALTP
jgi:LysR family hydrogen peroxide-inducible transcriptional activator